MNLEEQVALVTAAGRGIGRGIAESLAQAGASLVINSYSEDTVNETARRCEACLLYTSPSPRDVEESRMPSSA